MVVRFVGLGKIKSNTANSYLGRVEGRGRPMDKTEQEYAKWMELKLDDNPLFTIIAPFEKKYAWCVVWIEGVEGCPANMCATAPGTKGRFCSKPSRSRAASY